MAEASVAIFPLLNYRGRICRKRLQEAVIVVFTGAGISVESGIRIYIRLGDTCERGSQLRPHVVWFGEMVPALERAEEIVREADILLVVAPLSLCIRPRISRSSPPPKREIPWSRVSEATRCGAKPGMSKGFS